MFHGLICPICPVGMTAYFMPPAELRIGQLLVVLRICGTAAGAPHIISFENRWDALGTRAYEKYEDK